MAASEQATFDSAQKTRLLELEERRFALDEELRRREMAVRESEAKRAAVLSPARVSLIGAVLTLLGGVLGAVITAELNARGELDLERQRFESTLILEAIKASSRSEAVRNLDFFLDAGFISDPDGKIAKLSPASYPSLTEPSKEASTRAIQSTGMLIIKSRSERWVCTATLVAPKHVITVAHCLDPAHYNLPPSTALEFAFSIGTTTTPLTVVKTLPDADVALLALSAADLDDPPIQRWNVRDPIEGENVYLAFYLPEAQSIQLRVCKVVAVERSDFRHSCEAGPGSSGALVIAVSDDAILGIQYGRVHGAEPPTGIAHKMSVALTALDPIIAGAL